MLLPSYLLLTVFYVQYILFILLAKREVATSDGRYMSVRSSGEDVVDRTVCTPLRLPGTF